MPQCLQHCSCASGGFCRNRQVGACPPFFPQCLQHCSCASGGPFFSALPEKNGEKRGALGRVDFYRTTTTEAPKFVTSCKRTYSPKRNYPLQARQSDSPNLQLVASEPVPTIPTASKTKVTPACSPKLPSLRTSFQPSTGNSAAPCPAVTRNKSSSRLRRNRTAVPSRSPGELIQKRGRARPLYWPSGDRQGGPSEGPLDRLSLHRRRRFLSPRERKGGRAAPLAGTARKTAQP